MRETARVPLSNEIEVFAIFQRHRVVKCLKSDVI